MKVSTEIRDIISAWFGSAARGDAEWVKRHISVAPETRLVGTDPDEWLAGMQVSEFLTNEAQTMGGVVTATVSQVEAFEEGTIGWGVARPVITLPDGKSVSPRWSAVFRNEDGEWRAVQVHASFGIPNDETFG